MFTLQDSSPASPVRQASGGGGVVLMLHPCDETRSLIAEAAHFEGAAFTSCCDVESCLQSLQAEGPVCVVAHSHAVVKAPRLIDQIEQAERDTPVVGIAPADELLNREESQRLGFWSLLPAPPAPSTLTLALRSALEEAARRDDDRRLVETFWRDFAQLSHEEQQVMKAVCDGKLNKQIAREFGVSIRTVEQRRRRVFAKMKVGSAVPLAKQMATVAAIERFRSRRRTGVVT